MQLPAWKRFPLLNSSRILASLVNEGKVVNLLFLKLIWKTNNEPIFFTGKLDNWDGMRKMFSAVPEHLKVSRWTIITANNPLASSAILMLTITRPACEVHYKTCELWDWAKRPQGLSASCGGGAVQDGGEEFKLTSFTHKERPNHFQNLRISAFSPRSPPLPWKTGLPPSEELSIHTTPPAPLPTYLHRHVAKKAKKQTEISTLVRYWWRTRLFLIFLEYKKRPCCYYLGVGDITFHQIKAIPLGLLHCIAPL